MSTIKAMDPLEKIAIGLALSMMTVFFSAVVFASAGLGVGVPTCVTNLPPFAEGKIIRGSGKNIEVHAVAKMWMFDMGDANIGELRVPEGTEVNLYLASGDVVHGFHIEGKNVNLMAVPGAVNNTKVMFDKIGEYKIVCHEYCGIQHQMMAGVIKVMPEAEYNKTMQEEQQQAQPQETPQAQQPEKTQDKPQEKPNGGQQ